MNGNQKYCTDLLQVTFVIFCARIWNLFVIYNFHPIAHLYWLCSVQVTQALLIHRLYGASICMYVRTVNDKYVLLLLDYLLLIVWLHFYRNAGKIHTFAIIIVVSFTGEQVGFYNAITESPFIDEMYKNVVELTVLPFYAQLCSFCFRLNDFLKN